MKKVLMTLLVWVGFCAPVFAYHNPDCTIWIEAINTHVSLTSPRDVREWVTCDSHATPPPSTLYPLYCTVTDTFTHKLVPATYRIKINGVYPPKIVENTMGLYTSKVIGDPTKVGGITITVDAGRPNGKVLFCTQWF